MRLQTERYAATFSGNQLYPDTHPPWQKMLEGLQSMMRSRHRCRRM